MSFDLSQHNIPVSVEFNLYDLVQQSPIMFIQLATNKTFNTLCLTPLIPRSVTAIRLLWKSTNQKRLHYKRLLCHSKTSCLCCCMKNWEIHCIRNSHKIYIHQWAGGGPGTKAVATSKTESITVHVLCVSACTYSLRGSLNKELRQTLDKQYCSTLKKELISGKSGYKVEKGLMAELIGEHFPHYYMKICFDFQMNQNKVITRGSLTIDSCARLFWWKHFQAIHRCSVNSSFCVCSYCLSFHVFKFLL